MRSCISTPVCWVQHVDSSRGQVSHAFVIFYFLYITIIAAWLGVWSKSFVSDVHGATGCHRPAMDFSPSWANGGLSSWIISGILVLFGWLVGPVWVRFQFVSSGSFNHSNIKHAKLLHGFPIIARYRQAPVGANQTMMQGLQHLIGSLLRQLMGMRGRKFFRSAYAQSAKHMHTHAYRPYMCLSNLCLNMLLSRVFRAPLYAFFW